MTVARHDTTMTRHPPKPVLAEHKRTFIPPVSHPALSERRTLFPTTVVHPDEADRVLVSGHNNRKIGAVITKGPWKGFPIYTLTLEERATCPITCRHWRSCFGNSLNWARRHEHGPALEKRIRIEVENFAEKHPNGFAVRLHVLGDFYSPEYVRFWVGLLALFPPLHVFGFSARWDQNDPIARELIPAVRDHWNRFAIRFSNAPIDECSTVSIEHPFQKPEDAITCPAQLSQTDSCATCGLCWGTRRRICFIQH